MDSTKSFKSVFYVVFAILLIGNVETSISAPRIQMPKGPQTVNDSGINPQIEQAILQCVDFQDLPPSSVSQMKYDIGSIKVFERNGLRIISRPNPDSARNKLPNPLHYLQVDGSKLGLGSVTEITFSRPVKRVQINLSEGRREMGKKASINSTLYDSLGRPSKSRFHDAGPTVKTMIFNAFVEQVSTGDSEFKPEEWHPAKDIEKILIYAANTEVWILNICSK